jgi:hypothetical protein
MANRPMTRLELLHTIQENSDLLDLNDRFALLASDLPNSPGVRRAWEALAAELMPLPPSC